MGRNSFGGRGMNGNFGRNGSYNRGFGNRQNMGTSGFSNGATAGLGNGAFGGNGGMGMGRYYHRHHHHRNLAGIQGNNLGGLNTGAGKLNGTGPAAGSGKTGNQSNRKAGGANGGAAKAAA
jgi:hypothetical protein